MHRRPRADPKLLDLNAPRMPHYMCRKAGSLSRPPQIAVFPTAPRKNWTYAYLSGHRDPHSGLLFHHRRCSAAERHERRHLSCIRRPRQPDGFRTPRCRQCSVEGHNLVGGGVHAHFDHVVHLRHQARRPELRPARCEVATGKDAARAGANADNASHPKVKIRSERRVSAKSCRSQPRRILSLKPFQGNSHQTCGFGVIVFP